MEEQRIEQLEKTVSALHAEINALKELLASALKKSEANFGSIKISVGLQLARLTDEISKISEDADIGTAKI